MYFITHYFDSDEYIMVLYMYRICIWKVDTYDHQSPIQHKNIV